jgi:hypothetical protein
MKRNKLFYSVLIVAITSIGSITGQLFGQDIESKSSRILLNNLSEDKAAPEIKIITPSIGEGEGYSSDADVIDIIGEVKDQTGVKFVSVNSDIRTVNSAGIFSTRIQLEVGENKIRIMVSDVKDNISEQYLTVWYNPPKLSLSDKIKQESTYYGLVIGINDYEDHDLHDLDNPIQDASKLHKALLENYTFEPGNVTLLKNPDRDDIVFALDDLAKRVTPDDNVLIFYAGHGYWDERSNVGYWLPSDAYMSNTANWFRNSTLVDYLKMIDSKHTLLITDACFAGSIFKTRSGFAKPDRAYEILYEQSSRKAMTSGALTEVPDRSYFTRYLVERLEDNEESYLSSEQLFSSFRIAVINNSDAIPMYGEIRNVGDEGGDFIFLKKK